MKFALRPVGLLCAVLAGLAAVGGCSQPAASCVTSNETLTLCARSTQEGVAVTASGLAGYTSASVGWAGETRLDVPPHAEGSLPDEFSTVLAPSKTAQQVSFYAILDGRTMSLTVKP